MPSFTPEQLEAIGRRSGNLLLDASAGSGKTSVLVERFVRAVIDDGVPAAAILTITFTEKAATELRDRIRHRLRELGADEQARATEGAFISTIHGFCSRVLRANALRAGIDPGFSVLDQLTAQRLAERAFDGALEELARDEEGAEALVAGYGIASLREAILDVHEELRARGRRHPQLPPLPPPPDVEALRDQLTDAARAASAELGEVADPAARVVRALERLDRCQAVLAEAEVWPGELDGLALGGNGAALCTPVCIAYAEALDRYRQACKYPYAERAHHLLGDLLARFAAGYAQLKRASASLDFADLELQARDLLGSDRDLRERYRRRFEQVMVDELQDTNPVQLDLITSIAEDNLFTVGDAQQSIYGFRHAEVELFEQLGAIRERAGERLTLSVNFRTRADVIEVLNRAFGRALGDRFRELRAGRSDPPSLDPPVELLLADKGAQRTGDGLAAPWRLAEAAALADRIAELVERGTAPREIVVLTRATTDLRAYEAALERVGVPTYLIGGRGYWAHPQVVDFVCYLRALANPRDEEALYTVMASPLVGLSLDGLVVLAAAAQAAESDPWTVVQSPQGRLARLDDVDAGRLSRFSAWFADERAASVHTGAPALIERALEVSGYDLAMLAMPGGRRRLANVRKLMRLGREHQALSGPDLRGFLRLVGESSGDDLGGGDPRESEAPVEGEALDAVRLMTIHRAKGLEFETVCVADLGRGPAYSAELLRVGREGSFGLQLAEPGSGKREPALAYEALGAEQQELDQQEERRLFYVAATRARERLILSGAVKFAAWPSGGGGPIRWLGPAFIADLADRVAEGVGGTEEGVRLTLVEPAEEPAMSPGVAATSPSVPSPSPAPPGVARRGEPSPPSITRLSYSALSAYHRCPYRFYAERVLGLPAVEERSGGTWSPAVEPALLTGTERGVLAHAVLQRLDFRRPVPVPAATVVPAGVRHPGSAEAAEIDRLIERFAGGPLCARLASAGSARREEPFAFLLDQVLITGSFDVLAREAGEKMLVVDYKTDRVGSAEELDGIVRDRYADQRLIYALAALRAGAREVEVLYVFLEAPDQPVAARFPTEEIGVLEQELGRRTLAVREGSFPVTEAPQRPVCGGCPAEGGLCSWPTEMTRRDSAAQLF